MNVDLLCREDSPKTSVSKSMFPMILSFPKNKKERKGKSLETEGFYSQVSWEKNRLNNFSKSGLLFIKASNYFIYCEHPQVGKGGGLDYSMGHY